MKFRLRRYKFRLRRYFYKESNYCYFKIWIVLLTSSLLFVSCEIGRNNTNSNSDHKQQIDSTSIGYIEIDEEIEIEPEICSFKEIERLYLKYRKGKNVQNLDSLIPHLQEYFVGMEDGNNPFELFIEYPKYELKVDTTILRVFLEEIKSGSE